MKKNWRFGAVVVTLAVAGLITTAALADAGQAKVEICHLDKHNGTFKMISVGEPAVKAHMRHGDHYPYFVWQDGDGDGYGAGAASKVCVTPAGWVQNDDDCDDGNPAVFPGAEEVCNGIDDDCDGGVDEGLTFDVDGDGYTSLDSCEGSKDDCVDTNPAINPGAAEVCNGIDDNCSGAVDEGLTFDADSDGYTSLDSCEGSKDDCVDSNPAINPGAAEVCNGIDDNCSGAVDEGLTFDADSDGYTSTDSCEGSKDDCDDADPAVNPGATEACNGYDDDCDGSVDEGLTFDADSDGYTSLTSCEGSASDCNDGNAAINPGATEVCDGVDNDCDGSVDEGGICASKIVFVSSQLFTGNFGAGYGGDGLAGADAQCQLLAGLAGLSGTFRAWLSGRPEGCANGGDQDVLDRFTQNPGPYQLVNGTKVADSFADLTDGSLDHAINVTELNTPVGTELRVWTNTLINGNGFDYRRDCAYGGGPQTWVCDPVYECPYESGNYGFANSTTSTWTTAPSNNDACSNVFHLYCFEQ